MVLLMFSLYLYFVWQEAERLIHLYQGSSQCLSSYYRKNLSNDQQGLTPCVFERFCAHIKKLSNYQVDSLICSSLKWFFYFYLFFFQLNWTINFSFGFSVCFSFASLPRDNRLKVRRIIHLLQIVLLLFFRR